MQVYLNKLYGDQNGMTKLMLRNKAGDMGLAIATPSTSCPS